MARALAGPDEPWSDYALAVLACRVEDVDALRDAVEAADALHGDEDGGIETAAVGDASAVRIQDGAVLALRHRRRPR